MTYPQQPSNVPPYAPQPPGYDSQPAYYPSQQPPNYGGAPQPPPGQPMYAPQPGYPPQPSQPGYPPQPGYPAQPNAQGVYAPQPYPAGQGGYYQSGPNQPQAQTIIVQQPDYHDNERGRKKQSDGTATGCCAGILAALACCCVLDTCGDCMDCDFDCCSDVDFD